MKSMTEGLRRRCKLSDVRILLIVSLLFFPMCEQEELEECGAKKVSAAALAESHQPGRNCMNCHRAAGGGEGCFVVAGTVYDSAGSTPVAGAIMRMRTLEAGGDIRVDLTSDVNGNFYTTESVDFSGGIYPSVMRPGGAASYMQYPVTLGSCNCCHGVTAGRVRIK